MTGSTSKHLKIRKYTSGGKTYIYAWRNGPRIYSPEGTPEYYAEIAEAHRVRSEPVKGDTLLSVISEFERSTDFKKLAIGSQKNHRRSFEAIEPKFADAPMAAFDRPKMRKEIRVWHQAIKTDRGADLALGTLSVLIEFAIRDGLCTTNPARAMKKRWTSDPEPTPWTDEDIETFREEADSHLVRVMEMALYTGLARADLVRVGPGHDKGKSLNGRRTKTSKGFRVSMTDDLREFLDGLPPRDATTYLVNSKGLPWTRDGLSASFDKRRRELGIKSTLHDLRANRACQLYKAEFSDEDVADELGWSLKTVRHIRRHYADADAILERRIGKLNKNTT